MSNYGAYNDPMANLITLTRIVILLVVVWLVYQAPSIWQLGSFFLVILIFVCDALDGYIARARNEVSLFGAHFDIAGDRIVELTMWVVVADIELVPIWIPLTVIIRAVLVDTIRTNLSASKNIPPFALIRSALGQFLVASQSMRILYAIVKACAFCCLVTLPSFPAILPELWDSIGSFWTSLTYFFVYFSVFLCIVRAVPVVAECICDKKKYSKNFSKK